MDKYLTPTYFGRLAHNLPYPSCSETPVVIQRAMPDGQERNGRGEIRDSVYSLTTKRNLSTTNILRAPMANFDTKGHCMGFREWQATAYTPEEYSLADLASPQTSLSHDLRTGDPAIEDAHLDAEGDPVGFTLEKASERVLHHPDGVMATCGSLAPRFWTCKKSLDGTNKASGVRGLQGNPDHFAISIGFRVRCLATISP